MKTKNKIIILLCFALSSQFCNAIELPESISNYLTQPITLEQALKVARDAAIKPMTYFGHILQQAPGEELQSYLPYSKLIIPFFLGGVTAEYLRSTFANVLLAFNGKRSLPIIYQIKEDLKNYASELRIMNKKILQNLSPLTLVQDIKLTLAQKNTVQKIANGANNSLGKIYFFSSNTIEHILRIVNPLHAIPSWFNEFSSFQTINNIAHKDMCSISINDTKDLIDALEYLSNNWAQSILSLLYHKITGG